MFTTTKYVSTFMCTVPTFIWINMYFQIRIICCIRRHFVSLSFAIYITCFQRWCLLQVNYRLMNATPAGNYYNQLHWAGAATILSDPIHIHIHDSVINRNLNLPLTVKVSRYLIVQILWYIYTFMYVHVENFLREKYEKFVDCIYRLV